MRHHHLATISAATLIALASVGTALAAPGVGGGAQDRQQQQAQTPAQAQQQTQTVRQQDVTPLTLQDQQRDRDQLRDQQRDRDQLHDPLLDRDQLQNRDRAQGVDQLEDPVQDRLRERDRVGGFTMGFGTMAGMMGSIAGQPIEDEWHGANGDAIQHTTTGMMVWRKADNWTAFTDGSRTWVNGPYGLQERLNTERFPWEAQ